MFKPPTQTKVSIGNDIVDLAAVQKGLHPRYIKRVFSSEERKRIATNEARLWLYWAAKEAAFKTLKRLFPDLSFSPISLTFDHETDLVASKFGTLQCKKTINKKYVHVECAAASSKGMVVNYQTDRIESWIAEDTKSSDRDSTPSSRVRAFAAECIAQLLGIEAAPIHISKSLQSIGSKDTIPYLFIDDQESKHIISLSHDGHFLACSFLEALTV